MAVAPHGGDEALAGAMPSLLMVVAPHAGDKAEFYVAPVTGIEVALHGGDEATLAGNRAAYKPLVPHGALSHRPAY